LRLLLVLNQRRRIKQNKNITPPRLDAFLLRRIAPPRQHRLQKRSGIAPLLPRNILRRAGGDDFAAAVAVFRAEIDDPVDGF
jgi:hypothetical protein